MAKGLLGTPRAAGSLADVESQAARSERFVVLIADHQAGRLRFDDGSPLVQKFTQESCQIRSRGMRSTPGGTKFASVGTVPIPFLGGGIARS